ncbi:hypothetical protein GQ44DRAFT_625283, partial [Phaeosphaeriaceae sp. PMI808]
IVFIDITSAMTALATASVIARFVSRLKTISLWWDDWAILASLVFAYGYLTTTILVATVRGAGYHIFEYSLAQLEKYLKIALANNVIYNASITMSKASVLLFYRRIFFVDRWLARSVNTTAFVLTGYFFAAAGGLIFLNNPIVGQWNLAIPSESINNKVFWLAMAIINIFFDVIILALPQARVCKLQLSRTKKILVSLVFLLGGLVCIMSIIRITSLLTIEIADLTYTLTTPGIWTMVKMGTSIICACLPMIPGLFRAEKGTKRAGSGLPSGQSKSGLLDSAGKDKNKGHSDLERHTNIGVRRTVEARHESGTESDTIVLRHYQVGH